MEAHDSEPGDPGITDRNLKTVSRKYDTHRWDRENPGKKKAADKAWAIANREQLRAYQRDYHRKHPEKAWAKHLKKAYGLTIETWNVMFELQHGHCLFCEATKLCVDHDHETGRIRGLLCDSCNKALAGIEKAPLLASAKVLEYLKR